MSIADSNHSLKSLCSSIREKIINEVSKNGGYLSTNLSIVEIAASLNKCFSDKDKIIYSGANMNYADNIINNREVLNNDICNSLATGLGICVSRDLNHENFNVISVVNSENAYSAENIEALNQIGLEKRKMIIVFNDDTSINKGIGIVDKFISDLRNTRTYNNLKDSVKDILRPQKGGEKIIENIHNFKSNIKKTVINEGVFGEYNIDYIGPVDGHNLDELQRAFEIAKTKEYPVVIHCITTKGNGFVYAETNTKDIYYLTDPFDIKTGKKYVENNQEMRDIKEFVCDDVIELMSKNDKVILITTNRNKLNLNRAFSKYPSRCFESNNDSNYALNFAYGLAKDGRLPIICLNSRNINESYDSLVNQFDNRKTNMIILDLFKNNEDSNVIRCLKNCCISTVNDSNEIADFLEIASDSENISIIRLDDKYIRKNDNTKKCEISIGKWQKIANNNIEEVVILANGFEINEISDSIKKNKLKYTLINTCFINPIDDKLLKQIFKKSKKIYVFNNPIENTVIEESIKENYKGKLIIYNEKTIKELLKDIERK